MVAKLNLELHHLCSIFPRMAGEEFKALKADIAANGLLHPITVYQGKILDGGNRYRACVELGLEPKTTEYEGAVPVSFVLSENLHRRHLSPGQTASIVSNSQDWEQAQPACRPTKECNVAPLSTAADRAAISGASLRTQKMADAVSKSDPELSELVAHGKLTLPAASRQLAARDAVKKFDPELWKKVESGKMTLESAHNKVKADQREKERVKESIAREAANKVKKADPIKAARKEIANARKEGTPRLAYYAKYVTEVAMAHEDVTEVELASAHRIRAAADRIIAMAEAQGTCKA
jgi:ParB-like chromosome segregation protein Spo0J